MLVKPANRVAPQYRLGARAQSASTIKEALHIAGLDGEVKVSDYAVNATVMTEEGVSTISVPDKFMTYRQTATDLVPLGVVGKRYVPIQDVEAFDFLNLLVDESGANFDSVGTLAGGKRTYVSIEMPSTVTIANDSTQMYLFASNSHDGSTAFNVGVTPVRLACTNQIRRVVRSAPAKISLKHTSGLKGKVAQVQETLGLIYKYQDAFEQEVYELLNADFSSTDYEKLVETIVPINYDMDTKTKITTSETMRGDLLNLWNAPTQDGIRGSKYAAFNAVAEYADWFKPVRGGNDKEVMRAERILTGAGDELKTKALALL